MKFNIMGFNQMKLTENYSNLNCNDVVVLRALIDMIPMMDVKIKENNKEYTWVMYRLLVKNLPFITNSESTMKKIVQKLIDAGLIERLVLNRGGKYTYFRKTQKCIDLEYQTESVNEADESAELDDINKYKVSKVKKVLSEKINKKTISTIIETSSLILQKAIASCEEKEIVTNSYFLNAIKIASQPLEQNYCPKDSLSFFNFESREYDYDDLERKLLGWTENNI